MLPMSKFISIEEAVSKVKDGMTIMVGGFLANGTPNKIVDALAKSGVKNLTLICNDTAYPDKGVGQLIANKQVKKLFVSHIGTNPHTSEQMNSGELEIEFCPQGSLAERVRAGGCGLGGILTQTGMGTIVAEGKQIVNVDGKDYLLEKPLRADIALVGASLGDKAGNLVYRGTSQNFNPLMASAADLVIAEINELVEVGEIAAENVKTPSIMVDFIIEN
ncbi:acetyl-CoA--acetoacetyl-CoA transferase subunit alpha [Odoribacteraceae bacterium]|jgi:3-oxoacid coA-transferase, A subunit|nr:acetyl-CoA--acetoacetyl-CoA transferase subunit alpha [Odoribacteraceae bacterium]BEI57236.1 CoA transferase subunit A [Butyricimonas faecihominis]GGJ70975.1 acetyl-CoA--acetoacetyl-CoA transferase subunit alpha [Butyricimonas paravirosa]GGJ41757.1 acetyl-CoA--acetoacetyl-CoA transferase subunit alpha [Butyricimonas faecihominis]GKH95762.1 acetyl-CoA--acetoacetyl-CoA transferase subunit alpha [Odoribacteraceae bacterium]